MKKTNNHTHTYYSTHDYLLNDHNQTTLTHDNDGYFEKPNGEKRQMANLRESALEYESPTTKNITKLAKVSTQLDLKNKVVGEGTKDAFSYNFIVVDDEEYRVPNSVLKQLKAQLAEKPDVTDFKVTKTGEGMKTEYTVILLD